MIEVYESSDYAGMVVGTWEFYFGYEVTQEEDGPWCFRAKHNSKDICTIPFPELGLEKGATEMENLSGSVLAGIGQMIARGILSVTE